MSTPTVPPPPPGFDSWLALWDKVKDSDTKSKDIAILTNFDELYYARPTKEEVNNLTQLVGYSANLALMNAPLESATEVLFKLEKIAL